MTIRNQVEKLLKKEIEYELDEIDIDGLVKRFITDKKVKQMVDTMIRDKIAEEIEVKIYTEIYKQQPIIEAWTVEKVKGFLHELGVK